MLESELRELERLAGMDALRGQLESWIAQPTDWEPAKRCQALLTRLLARIETLRVRMEAPLVVATFGGTGTGKSTLVNAIVGEDVTRAGRQRPTTRAPVLIAHSRSDLSALGMPLDEVELVQRDAEFLRDLIILDCPDPDTTEGESPGSNLDRLRTLLPYCDVLLYVSTQQKYRSARVTDELLSAASGCRMLFVQTHADLDEDIREDWRRTLANEYAVSDVYFVDSIAALKQRQSGEQPTGDMGRLLDLLTNKLNASERVRVRRANLLDLLDAALSRCQETLAGSRSGLAQLTAALAKQRESLTRRMARQLQDELLASQGLWERRLLSAVTDRWGMSPFSWVLRTYNGLGSLIASTMLFRARSTAQLALLGSLQGARWLQGKRKEQAAESTLERVSHFRIDDGLLRESELVIDGYATEAGLVRTADRGRTISDLRRDAAAVEAQFMGDAGGRIDEIISDLSEQNSRWWVRVGYEVVLAAYLLFVLYRVGRNFFWDSFLYERPLLSADFYLAAGLFLLLCCGLLVMLFTRRLQRGLESRIRQLAGELVDSRLCGSLFPELEEGIRRAERMCDELSRMQAQAVALRDSERSVAIIGVGSKR